ncbi:PDGF- and VEGF-related factor 1 [Carabus blaptoides fortunei]
MMNVRLAVCVLFCLIACSVEGNRDYIHHGHINNYVQNIDGHEYEKCHNKNYKDAMKQSYSQVKCQPRDAVVKLTTSNGYSLVPDKVIVKRCHESGCYGRKSCAPVKMREIRVAVRMMSHGNSMMECGWINVTEHTECKCGCMVKPDHCNMKQEYVADQCMCKCTNYALRDECLSTKMRWDEETCTCKCNSDMKQCSTGTYWVPEMCKCMKMMLMDNDYDKYLMLN